MNPGDLKNTFIDKDGVERTVVIPAEVFRNARREKISNKVAIQRFLAEEGYLDKTAVEETAKANTSSKRTRKPNETKLEIMSHILASISERYPEAETVNPERQIRFAVDGNIYELTLVQKRKPKV